MRASPFAGRGGQKMARDFCGAGCHVLMVTNHGVHEWSVTPGMPDTGGQNVYVNHFTEALVAQGYRVTVVNRGGYPHPLTGVPQSGERPHPSGRARIVYVEDGLPEFVRKEDMGERLPLLADDLKHKVAGDPFDLIVSHYWDGCKLGTLVNESGVPHAWIPHSLGAIKKRNMDPSTWAGLRIDERIEAEHGLMAELDARVATSTAIRDSFEQDYGAECRHFLPPCVDPLRYRPLRRWRLRPLWRFLSGLSPLSPREISKRKIVAEISRTDKTKRKDVLIRAFAGVKSWVPDALLLVSIDDKSPLHPELMALIRELDLEQDVIVLGSVWEWLPLIYNATDVYCTPSVMEGFGMTPQEAAACGKPAVSSDLVPFAAEYLLGDNPSREGGFLLGEAGAVVKADDVSGFVAAMVRLLRDGGLRRQLGQRALQITIPYFTWENRTGDLMRDLGVSP